MKSFLDLRQKFKISYQAFYKFLQIRHAIQVQFRFQVMVWTQIPVLLRIINLASTKGLISKLYASLGDRSINGVRSLKSREGWERVIGPITMEQWYKILEQGPLVSISPSQKVSY